jgi:hypothetical protein
MLSIIHKNPSKYPVVNEAKTSQKKSCSETIDGKASEHAYLAKQLGTSVIHGPSDSKICFPEQHH